MPGYIIGRVDVDDPSQLKGYQIATPLVVKQFGGKFIVRGGPVSRLEDADDYRRVVIMEFPTLSAAEALYYSEEYAQARELREGIGAFEFIALEGEDA